jgi:drug/metabolite transporter (DMT)-like permease
MHSNTQPLHRPSRLPGDMSGRLTRGTLASLLAVATLTALCYPLLSVGLNLAPPLQFATLRAGVAGLALLMLAFAMRRPFPQTRVLWLQLGASGIFSTTIGFASMFGAAGLIAPGIAAVVAGTQPIVAALLALVVFGQPFGKWQAIGMSVALVGLAAMTLQDISAGGTTAVAGVALVVAATVGSAIGNALTKRFASDVDPIAAAAVQLLLGAGPLAIFAFRTAHFSRAGTPLSCVGNRLGHRWHGRNFHVMDLGSQGLSAKHRERLQLRCPAFGGRDQCWLSGRESYSACCGGNGFDDQRDRTCRPARMTGQAGTGQNVSEVSQSRLAHPMQTVQISRQQDRNQQRS